LCLAGRDGAPAPPLVREWRGWGPDHRQISPATPRHTWPRHQSRHFWVYKEIWTLGKEEKGKIIGVN